MVSLFQEMQDIDPDRNPVFTAIDRLESKKDICTFMNEYEDFLLNCGESTIAGREVEIARSNVGYILGYYSQEKRDLWYGILEEVSHPYFGRNYTDGGL